MAKGHEESQNSGKKQNKKYLCVIILQGDTPISGIAFTYIA